MSATTLPPEGYAELLALPQWVNAEASKIPYTPSLVGEKVKAKAGEASTFGTSAEALAAQAAGRFPYCGFEFMQDDPYFLVDLDGQRDPATGTPTPLAAAVLALLRTLAEPSVSGKGYHLIARGTLPPGLLDGGRLGKKVGPCEIYFGAHYGLMTFAPLRHFQQIRDVDEATIRILFRLLFPEEPKVAQPVAPQVVTPIDWDDTALLAHAFAAKGGEAFRQQHNGAESHTSPSEGDFGLLSHLYFWCQGDAQRMRRIALTSARVRDKWFTRRGDGDWLDYSISNIIKEGGPVYEGTYHSAPPASTVGHDTHDTGALAGLLADVQRLTGQVQARDAEIARLVGRNAELEEENRALHDTRRYPDQTVGGAIWDVARALKKGYDRPTDLITEDGKDYVPLFCKQAAEDRSASTVGRTSERIRATGRVDTITRAMAIETDTAELKVDIQHFYVPPEARRSAAAIVRHLLPPAVEKKHGGSRPRAVIPTPDKPREFPAAPVRRHTETVETFYCAVNKDKLGSNRVGKPHTDYFTYSGEPISFAEAVRIQVEAGHTPPAMPGYMKASGAASTRIPSIYNEGLQLESAPEPEPKHGRCAYCHRPRLGPDAPYCGHHAPNGAAYASLTEQLGYAVAASD